MEVEGPGLLHPLPRQPWLPPLRFSPGSCCERNRKYLLYQTNMLLPRGSLGLGRGAKSPVQYEPLVDPAAMAKQPPHAASCLQAGGLSMHQEALCPGNMGWAVPIPARPLSWPLHCPHHHPGHPALGLGKLAFAHAAKGAALGCAQRRQVGNPPPASALC